MSKREDHIAALHEELEHNETSALFNLIVSRTLSVISLGGIGLAFKNAANGDTGSAVGALVLTAATGFYSYKTYKQAAHARDRADVIRPTLDRLE